MTVSYRIFEPITIKGMTLQNRIMRSATWDGTADESGGVTEDSLKLYRALAEGGIGLIVTGYAFVSHPLGQANPGQYGIYKDDLIPGWKKLVQAVHDAGESKIAMQIVHAGINSRYLYQKGETLQAVSFLPDLTRPHREMSGREIEGIIADFAAAAVRAREAGFDAVQLHGAHGYLMSQFASPIYNRRDDFWGGSPEKRRRFHLKVIEKVREAVGEDYPLLIKLGIRDAQPGGMTLAEGLDLCRHMAAAGMDGIEISIGVGAGSAAVTRAAFETGEKDRVVFLDEAVAVKKEVSVPVAVVNGIRTLEKAEELVTVYGLDMVSLCRPFIREPGLVRRWLKGDTRPAACISCNQCFPDPEKGQIMECSEERKLRQRRKKA
jgi:2,4-dienoyl-CoA reductase-like NADH-dependent reductase (Old Yellow Enzyme family)